MAITPRQVKTLTEDEKEWIKSQFASIDRDIFTRYDGTHPLEVLLPYTAEHRAFVNEAFFRRAVSEYARCGWQIEDGGIRDDDRVIQLSDPNACAPFDVSQLAGQAQAALTDGALGHTADEDEREEELLAESIDEHGVDLNPSALEGEPGLEEEVETLWDPTEEIEIEIEQTAQDENHPLGNGAATGGYSAEESEEIEATAADGNEPVELAIDVLEDSFALLAPHAPELVERFYARLFSDYPEVEPFFEGVDMAAQQKHLINSLVLVANNLREPDKLQKALHALGQRHQNYGIEAEHYPMVSGTLLTVMEEFAGEAWTREVQEAWEGALSTIGKIMLDAYEEIMDPN
jgi:hemoglobin-like flavoprotein